MTEEKKEKNFHLLMQCLDDYNDQGCARPKPGARNFLWGSHMSARVHGPGPSSAAFSGASAGRWISSRADEALTGAHVGMPASKKRKRVRTRMVIQSGHGVRHKQNIDL